MKINELELELQLKTPGRQTLGCKNPGMQDTIRYNTIKKREEQLDVGKLGAIPLAVDP